MEKQIALGCMRIANMSIDKLLELANKYNVSKMPLQ